MVSGLIKQFERCLEHWAKALGDQHALLCQVPVFRPWLASLRVDALVGSKNTRVWYVKLYHDRDFYREQTQQVDHVLTEIR